MSYGAVQMGSLAVDVARVGLETAYDITSGYQSATAAADIARYNQRLAIRNAEQENINAAAATARANAAAEAETAEYARKEQLEREKNAKLRAYNIAVQGYSGMASDQGSSLLVNIDNAINAELNALDVRRIGQNEVNNIRYEGELNAFQHRLNAAQYLGEAENYRQQRKSILSSRNSQLWSGVASAPFQIFGSALSNFAKTYKGWSKILNDNNTAKQPDTRLNMNLPKMQVTGTNKWGSMA